MGYINFQWPWGGSKYAFKKSEKFMGHSLITHHHHRQLGPNKNPVWELHGSKYFIVCPWRLSVTLVVSVRDAHLAKTRKPMMLKLSLCNSLPPKAENLKWCQNSPSILLCTLTFSCHSVTDRQAFSWEFKSYWHRKYTKMVEWVFFLLKVETLN